MSKPKTILRKLMRPFTSHSRGDQNEVDLKTIAEQEQKNFSFQVLVTATKNFDSSLKLGQGGFGAVYRGTLRDGRIIAVKKLSLTSSQGKKEFQTEAKLLSRVQHRNVVHLLGYCAHEAEKLLVYEYVPHDSLDKLLFKSDDKRGLLDWKRRHGIIIGVAKGLYYLHEEAHCTIIHRDIKASNILLDDKWAPKIADFGMARLFSQDQTHVNTRAAGTNGYMAPEYLMHGSLSKKADVFSFGVVVLELISGEKNSTFSRDLNYRDLLEWVYNLYKNNRSLEAVDPTLASSSDPDQVVFCIWLGLQCVQSEPRLRPDMGRVNMMLSRKPSHLEAPTRPGYPGSRYRRYTQTGRSSATGASDTSSSGLGDSTSTQRSTTLTASTSGVRSPQRDSRGKRPMKYY